MSEDQEHLRWLSVFHYILGTLSALYVVFFLVVFGMSGVLMYRIMATQSSRPRNPPPTGFFIVIGAITIAALLWGVAVAVGTLLAGRFLATRKHYIFCFVVAGLNCSHFPLGTALGACSILVLSRDSVKALFAQKTQADPSTGTEIVAPT